MPRQIAQPKTEEAQRLERVRKTKGFDTLKDFHQALEDGGFSVAYQTLRNWHRGDREPAAGYYKALHEVFGARLEYLHGGPGPVFHDAPAADLSEAAQLIWEAGTGVSRDMFTKLLSRLLVSCPDVDSRSARENLDLVAHYLQLRVLETYRAFNPSGFDDQVRQNDHLEAMLHAMALAVPDRGQGVPLKKLLNNLEGRD